MRKLFYLVLLSFMLTNNASETFCSELIKWKMMFYPQEAYTDPYQKIFTPFNVSIAGDSTLVATDYHHSIIKSSDGGTTWNMICFEDNMLSGYEFLTGSFAFSPDTILLTFHRNSLLRTYNGGQTWDTIDAKMNIWFTSISFLKNGTGLASVVDPDTHALSQLLTYDFGSTWTALESVPDFMFVNQFELLNDSVIICKGVDDYIPTNMPIFFCRSDDRGHSWKTYQLPLPDSVSINNYLFVGDLVGYMNVNRDTSITDSNVQSINMFYKTTDGGISWQKKAEMFVSNSANIVDVDFIDPDHGTFFGHSGYFFRTSDGGESWNVDSTLREVDTDCITFKGRYIDEKSIFGVTSSGRFYLYSADGFPPDAVEGPIPGNTAFSISPNPAADHFNLSLGMTQAGDYTIEIVDMLGEPVVGPIQDYSADGVINKQIDVSQVPTGEYFIRISAAGAVRVGKLMVVR